MRIKTRIKRAIKRYTLAKQKQPPKNELDTSKRDERGRENRKGKRKEKKRERERERERVEGGSLPASSSLIIVEGVSLQQILRR
jgi:hypothetical protein